MYELSSLKSWILCPFVPHYYWYYYYTSFYFIIDDLSVVPIMFSTIILCCYSSCSVPSSNYFLFSPYVEP